MNRIACLGECMIELFERPDGTLTRSFGGDTLNTALYLARLGAPTEYVTALGTDPFSDEMLAAWRAEGIGTAAVMRVPGRLPGLYLIQTDAGGERTFFHWRDAAPVRQLFDLPETPSVVEALLGSELIYLSGITLSLFVGPSREKLFETLDAARRRGRRVAFDTNFRPRGWPDRDVAQAAYERMFAASDIVIASVEDHMLLYGSDDADELIDRVRAAQATEIVAKLARPACRVIAAGCACIVDAEPVPNVVDTTAAGDSFAAAYLAARRSGADPEMAARAGHRLAGTVIRYRGAIIPRDAMPDIPLQREAP